MPKRSPFKVQLCILDMPSHALPLLPGRSSRSVRVVRCCELCSATLRRFHVVPCLVLCPKLCHARLDSLSLCYYSPTVCLFALTCPAWQWSPCYPQTAPPPHVFGMGGEIAGTCKWICGFIWEIACTNSEVVPFPRVMIFTLFDTLSKLFSHDPFGGN